MNITRLLETSYEVLNSLVNDSGTDISSQDLMYLSSSIKVLDSLSYNEVNFIKDFKSQLYDIDDNISKIIKDRNDTNSAISRSYQIPRVMVSNDSTDKYRFIEIDNGDFLFIRGSNDKSKFEFYRSKDNCRTWSNILSLYNIQSSSSSYFKDGLAGIAVCKDKAEVNNREQDALRLFWIDSSQKLKTGIIIDGVDYINSEISIDDSSESKGSKILAGRNHNGDILVSYTVGLAVKALFKNNTKIDRLDGSTNKDRLEERVNSWITCKIDNGSTQEHLTNLVVVDDIFYQVITNNTNRWFLSIIFKNNYNEIISQSLVYNTTNCQGIHTYLTTFTGNRLLITTNSSTEMFKIDVKDDNDISKFKIDIISYGIPTSSTNISRVFENGLFINSNNKLYKNRSIYLYMIPNNIKYTTKPDIYIESDNIILAYNSVSNNIFNLVYKDEILKQYQTIKG